ncbi:MAG: RNA polymerase sigma factor [Thermodesulfobacteriota bacterium]
MDKLGVFYQRHREKLFYYLMRMTGDYYLSGDIMQESFTRLLKHYGPEVQDVPLLYKIARNAVLDHIRKNSRMSGLEEDECRDCSVDFERLLMVREEYRKVLAAMQKLGTDEREIIALVAGGNFSYREIAQITGFSEVNVRVKVHRARLRIKEILQQEKKNERDDQSVHRR